MTIDICSGENCCNPARDSDVVLVGQTSGNCAASACTVKVAANKKLAYPGNYEIDKKSYTFFVRKEYQGANNALQSKCSRLENDNEGSAEAKKQKAVYHLWPYKPLALGHKNSRACYLSKLGEIKCWGEQKAYTAFVF